MTSLIHTDFAMLFALWCGHALADFALQSDFIAKGKNRHTPVFNVPHGQTPQAIWPHVLTAHAMIHAGTVWMITGSFACALVEAVAHWWIDFAKCENWTSMHVDQALHLTCKLGYALVLSYA